MHRFSVGLLLIVAIGFLAGCSSSTELSPDEDKQLRHDFSRPLNEEELAQMGKSDPPAPPQKGE